MGIELRDVVTFLTAAGLISGAVIAYIRYNLSGDFVKSGEVVALNQKVTALEAQLRLAPSHEDMRSLGARMGEVERGVAVVSTKVEGMTALLQRVERHTDLLVQHQINEDGKP